LLLNHAVPDPRWQGAFERLPDGRLQLGDVNRYLDTIIELVDLRSGRVIVRERFDSVLTSFDGRRAVRTRSSEIGEPTYEVVAISLSPANVRR
jgi:hypothetical protein